MTQWTAAPKTLLVGLLFVLGMRGCSGGNRGRAQPPDIQSGPLSLAEARLYVLDLVNEDREEHGLARVTLDETASRAAQRHAVDMATHGFTAHWGTDGSVPEQRYTEVGGVHMIQENAVCFFDGLERAVDPAPVFTRAELERLESAFIDEVPPQDGHRRNILKSDHNRLGVGLAKPRGVGQACMAQEFVDAYGLYDDLPRRARVGQVVSVRGVVNEPSVFGAIGVARMPPAAPIQPDVLITASEYRIPEPYSVYFPPGYETPAPVRVAGGRFALELALDDQRQPGRYEVSVWARHPGNDELVMVSLRTVEVVP